MTAIFNLRKDKMQGMRKYKVAAVQLDTKNNKPENIKQVCDFIDEAASNGAKLICFPEDMNLIGRNVGDGGNAEEIPGYTADILMEKARDHQVYIHSGSYREKIQGEDRSFNTSILIDPQGKILAKYRKIHMFDVCLPDGTVCMESKRVCPGNQIVVTDTELGRLGFAICYDLRFPELFRQMAVAGAQVIFMPANFTKPTGKAHWEVLLRARAIENGCYLIAAGQCGVKAHYESNGNSMIVNPWGDILARLEDEPGLIYGEVDLDYLEEVRQQIPSLSNRREEVYKYR